MTYTYRRLFEPARESTFAEENGQSQGRALGDAPDRSIYVYEDDTVLAVNVALATGRPLLLRGDPGSGKSSLAKNVARCLGRRYHEHVITSRTQALDLLWTRDALRRLNDAQAEQLQDDPSYYIEPGVLWWAFNPVEAASIGRAGTRGSGTSEDTDLDRPAVVLLDEIDKADPGIPDDLLVPLGSFRFTVPELDREIRIRHHPLVMITTNGERALSAAFMRRCVVHTLTSPEAPKLVEIATAHFGDGDVPLYEAIANRVMEQRTDPRGPTSVPPSTAEFLDAVRACQELEIDPGADDGALALLLSATVAKTR